MPNLPSRRPVYETMRTRARSLRRKPTDAEAMLWALLRDRRLSQTKWRRQRPMGDYIVDFVCLEHCLVVECDGSQHADSERDAVRDAWLASQGFRVLRFWNRDVLNSRKNVFDTILAKCGLPF
jgi:very-short-patch-repair endonuclease